MSDTVLIVGATSAIARALSRQLASAGHNLYLAARDEDELARISEDLKARYRVRVSFSTFDIADTPSHLPLLHAVKHTMGDMEGVVVASGLLGDGMRARDNRDLAAEVFAVNYTGPALLLGHCAQEFETSGGGFIIGITSVAGDRGRQSNYIYGSAKGGLALFLQGLRNRLSRKNIQVLTVKPGFVDTAMTYGLPGMFLIASPDDVAKDVMKAIKRKRDVIYTPAFWRFIMLVIKHIPERIFKHLSL